MLRSVLVFAALFACVASAAAERRVALVIGNGAYANVRQLANPAVDAENVAALTFAYTLVPETKG